MVDWKMLRSVGHRSVNGASFVAGEVLLLGRLTYELILEMGSRITWLVMSLRFFLYVTLLTIPLWRASFIFILADYIEKNVRYGPNPRNHLDIYHPTKSSLHSQRKDNNAEEEEGGGRPIVVFVTGGAWIIGYKAWGAFMGMLLAQCGVIFISVDYRNFPQGTVTDMMTDVSTAIQWVFDHSKELGGRKDRIYVCGQSAGAHISSLVMLEQCKLEYLGQLDSNHHSNDNNSKEECFWSPRKLSGYIHIAGPCDMFALRDHCDKRGLYSDVIEHILEGDLLKHSPIHILQRDFIRSSDSSEGCGRIAAMSNSVFSDMAAQDYLGSSVEDNGEVLSSSDSDDDCSGLGLSTSSSSSSSSKMMIMMMRNQPKKSPQQQNSEVDLMNEEEENSDCKDESSSHLMMNQVSCLMDKKQSSEMKIPISLCPVYILHGAEDYSVPCLGSVMFAKLLSRLNCETYLKLYADKTHTGPILEDPIQGSDPLMCDVLRIVFYDGQYDSQSDECSKQIEHWVHFIEGRMKGHFHIPDFVVDFARVVCPF